MNICKIFGCYSTVEGKTEMCATHNYEARKKARITVKGVAKKNRIKPVSDKQADRNEVYMGIRNMYLQLFPRCQVKGCRCALAEHGFVKREQGASKELKNF